MPVQVLISQTISASSQLSLLSGLQVVIGALPVVRQVSCLDISLSGGVHQTLGDEAARKSYP